MNTKVISLVALSVLTVGAAQATQFNFQSTGVGTSVGTTLTGSDTILRQYEAPDPTATYTFVSFDYSYTANFLAGSHTGTGTLGTGTLVVHDVVANANKTLTFSFSGDTARTSVLNLNNVSITTPTFALGGSGLTGSIYFSTNIKGGVSKSSVFTNITPVPEPATMAALAIGGLGILSRRRKA